MADKVWPLSKEDRGEMAELITKMSADCTNQEAVVNALAAVMIASEIEALVEKLEEIKLTGYTIKMK